MTCLRSETQNNEFCKVIFPAIEKLTDSKNTTIIIIIFIRNPPPISLLSRNRFNRHHLVHHLIKNLIVGFITMFF